MGKINAQIRYLKEMIANKKMLIVDGMYLPDKMKAIMTDIKTVNFRVTGYEITNNDIISSSFYNQYKILYDNLLFDIQVQVTEHLQISTIMSQAYKSYLKDYVAVDDPAGQSFIEGEHKSMNNLVQDVSKKAADDYKSSNKLLEHFTKMF